jgi:hypothetical protein
VVDHGILKLADERRTSRSGISRGIKHSHPILITRIAEERKRRIIENIEKLDQ